MEERTKDSPAFAAGKAASAYSSSCWQEGMTLREYYAAVALPALLAKYNSYSFDKLYPIQNDDQSKFVCMQWSVTNADLHKIAKLAKDTDCIDCQFQWSGPAHPNIFWMTRCEKVN